MFVRKSTYDAACREAEQWKNGARELRLDLEYMTDKYDDLARRWNKKIKEPPKVVHASGSRRW